MGTEWHWGIALAFLRTLLARWTVSALPLGGKRMPILRTRFQQLWPWLILASTLLSRVSGGPAMWRVSCYGEVLHRLDGRGEAVAL